ncbi:substrate-binding periplasmic protein [Colwellia psychrerythraea]|uniref:Bacterial extracellular solute-binding protein, family 3 n=1 Tax=Colwellia psychrerythraea (strain 34H / ATCC BAA-681) TaxID=167879 RepID=Q481T2_COLP3|nr:transporter substrate-binding domain-containing protein [Colwellia psychrerythraea]AAZ26486.1 bacterial extracellular solute-binding protein, family 3 [Colwellia psychrerythraea 34H]
MKRLLSTVFTLSLAFSGMAYAEKITATGDSWPPFLSPDLPGQGIALQIVRAAFKEQGHEVEMTFVPWTRSIKAVKEGKVDILVGTWWTKKRTTFLNYSDDYLVNNIKFIKRVDDSFEYDGLESLNKKNVGVIRDYGYSDNFKKAMNFKKPETTKFINNLKKLVHNRIDLTLEDEIVARAFIKHEAPELKDKVSFSSSPLSSNTLHITSGLSNPKNNRIIADFNKGLAKIKTNGIYDSILKTNGLL